MSIYTSSSRPPRLPHHKPRFRPNTFDPFSLPKPRTVRSASRFGVVDNLTILVLQRKTAAQLFLDFLDNEFLCRMDDMMCMPWYQYNICISKGMDMLKMNSTENHRVPVSPPSIARDRTGDIARYRKIFRSLTASTNQFVDTLHSDRPSSLSTRGSRVAQQIVIRGFAE